MLRRLSLVLVGFALMMVTLAAASAAAQPLTVGSGDALDPRNPPFEAKPNDGEDDGARLQQWIDAGCASANKLLYLPPGDWHVTRRQLPGTVNIGSLRITCDGLTILGAGRASRILMQGSARLPANFRGPADWRVFDISAKGVTLEGIAIDGSQRSDTGEQTHLVHISGPAGDVELRRLYLNLPVLPKPANSVNCKPPEDTPEFNTRMCVVPGHRAVLCKDLTESPLCSVSDGTFTVLGWFQGGDCIRSVGEIATPVDGVSITDSHAAECDRSFIAFQRASFNFTVTGNVTRRVNDQVIDQEPTGKGGVGKILIMGNRFERGAGAQGPAAISLTGNGPGAELGDAMVVSGNVLDGGVSAFNASRVSIEHNIISGHPATRNSKPVIEILKHTSGLRIVGNDISRAATAAAGPVVSIATHGSGSPGDITIALNTISQNTDADVINMVGVQNVTVVDNTFHCNQTTGGVGSAVRGKSLRAVPDNPNTPEDESRPAVPLINLLVAQNRARGRCVSLVQVEPEGPSAPVGAVVVTENQTAGFSVGVNFAGSVLPSVKPRISDNLFEGTAPANFVLGPAGFTFNGNNGPQP